jgi:putative ABC transport system substrate-binding protein
VFEERFGDGRPDGLVEAARQLVQLKVDVIFTAGDQAIAAAKAATQNIPIVMLACDAVEAGLVASLARPGGNITGITCASGELGAKRAETLRELVAKLSRLAIVYNPADPHTRLEIAGVAKALLRWGAETHNFPVRDPGELERAFFEMAQKRTDSLYVVGESFTMFHRATIAQLAAKHRLPAVYAFREFVDEGGLVAYGPNLIEMVRAGAGFVNRILRGAKPADLPVEQPTRFELVINLKTAKALGLTIPPSLLLRADQVIE